MKAVLQSATKYQMVTFNSRRTVTFVRIMQIVMPVFMFLLMKGEHEALPWVVMIAALLLWEMVMFSMVFATLNEKGISYLRWGRWEQLNWSEIAYGGLVVIGFYLVKLPRRPIWNRYLLLRNPESKGEEDLSLRPGVVRFLELVEPPSGHTN